MSDESTRERILKVAEKLFSENGFDGTSLRAITAAADVNLAAVHYHFGSKTGLLEATVRRRIDPVNAERLRRLDAVITAAKPSQPSIEAVVDAFVRPAVEMLTKLDQQDMKGMLELVHGRDIPPAFFHETFRNLLDRFSILGELVPHLSADEIAWRMHFMVGSMIQAFNPRVTDLHPGLAQWDAEGIADALVAFLSAGFQAPTGVTYRPSPGAPAPAAPNADDSTLLDDSSSDRPSGQEQHR